MRGALYPTDEILTKKYAINPYHLRLKNEFLNNYCDEEMAQDLKGFWRQKSFHKDEVMPLDLEIGTGNGFFFAHHCFQNPNRGLVGIEIKYKPLYQTMRRMDSLGAGNGRGVRMFATKIDSIFAENEIDNTYIYFPDPWPKKRHHKNRLIQMDFLHSLYDVQKPGSFVEFKTDDAPYFEWTYERFLKSPYKMERCTYDLHQSEWAGENFVTHFEKLWTSQGFKIHLLRAYKV
jgi:tRNA (guanine-N7-)-methyltransferase